jgi:hypothetical protein
MNRLHVDNLQVVGTAIRGKRNRLLLDIRHNDGVLFNTIIANAWPNLFIHHSCHRR